jgi:hypothetical protein
MFLSTSEVFAEVDARRESGELSQSIRAGCPRFQASERFPGLIEQVQPNGEIAVGRFEYGQFQPVERCDL